MSKFNLAEAIGSALPVSKVSDSDTGETIVMISNRDLVGNPKNFYDISGLSELEDSIRTCGQVLSPLLVMPAEAGKYRIISGHRRRQAAISVFGPGCQLPCIIKRPKDEIEEEYLLIVSNSTARRLNSWELGQQAKRLTELIGKLRGQGAKLPEGVKTRDIVADQLGVSPSKLARIQAIENNLAVPGFKQKFQDGELPEYVAYKISQLPADTQYRFLDWSIDTGCQLTDKAVEEFSASLTEVPRKDIEQIILRYLGKEERKRLFAVASRCVSSAGMVAETKEAFGGYSHRGTYGPYDGYPSGGAGFDAAPSEIAFKLDSKALNPPNRRTTLTWPKAAKLIFEMYQQGTLLTEEERAEVETAQAVELEQAQQRIEGAALHSQTLSWSGCDTLPAPGSFAIVFDTSNGTADYCFFSGLRFRPYGAEDWGYMPDETLRWYLAPAPAGMDEEQLAAYRRRYMEAVL